MCYLPEISVPAAKGAIGGYTGPTFNQDSPGKWLPQDLFPINGRNCLLVVDYHSCFLETCLLAKKVISTANIPDEEYNLVSMIITHCAVRQCPPTLKFEVCRILQAV